MFVPSGAFSMVKAPFASVSADAMGPPEYSALHESHEAPVVSAATGALGT
jgi:hypothetical protein